MSLINEALKQAEAEKRHHNDQHASGLSDIQPVSPERTGDPTFIALVLLAFAIAAAITAGLFIFSDNAELRFPARANAWDIPAKREARSAQTRAKSTSSAEAKPASIDPEIRKILAMTDDAMRYYEPPTRPADAAEQASNAIACSESPLAENPETQQVSAEAAADKSVEQKKMDPIARFKLSGVMQGPDGGMAIINGQFIRIGGKIDDAEVISIGRYMVELEYKGDRFRLKL